MSSKIWLVAFDKQRDDEPVFIFKNSFSDKFNDTAYDQAVRFKNQIQLRGYRTKMWWEYEYGRLQTRTEPARRNAAFGG